MSEDNNNLNNSVDNNINPNELFNKPEETPIAETPTTEVVQEPVTLTPEPAEEVTTIQETPTTVNPEIGPVQTDLNQVPPTPLVNTNQDVTNIGFTEKIDKGKGIKRVLVIVVGLVALALLGYFVIYPIIANKFMSSPKNVFEVTINKVSTNVNQKLEQVKIGAGLYEINATIDTNIEELKEFANTSFKFRGGMDSDNKRIEGSALMITSDKKEVGGTFYVKNDYLFYKLTSDERIVKAHNLSENASYEAIFKNDKTVTSKDIQYLIDKTKELFFGQLKDDDFVKENNYKMTVNGNDVNTTKNTLVLDKSKYISVYKGVISSIYEDKEAMEIVAKLGTSKEEFKNQFYNRDFNDIEDDFKITANIYSISSEVVGFDIYSKDDKILYYYSNEGNIESAILPGDKDSEMTFVGTKDGDATNATLNITGKEIAKFKIYTFTEKEINFDYTFNISEDQKMSGTISLKEEDNNINYDLSVKQGSEHIKLKGNIKIEENAKIAEFDESSAVTLTEEEQNNILKSFLETTKGTPLEFLTESYGGNNYYNYYDDYGIYNGIYSEDDNSNYNTNRNELFTTEAKISNAFFN